MPSDHFLRELRVYREQCEKKDAEVARAANISRSHYSRIQSGQRCPSREVVIRIAEALEAGRLGKNRLLLAAGYAPEFDPSLWEKKRARTRVDRFTPTTTRDPALRTLSTS